MPSLKDVPADRQAGLGLAGFPEREDSRDAKFDDLPIGAVLGTARLRRAAQALHRRPDLQVVPLHGKVQTRLRKLADGVCDAPLLARSGLNRLGLAGRADEPSDPWDRPPAFGQGALAVETRTKDAAIWLQGLRPAHTTLTVAAERGALIALEGSCRTAVEAYVRIDGPSLRLTVQALTPDGSERPRREGRLAVADGDAGATALGLELGHAVRLSAGSKLEIP